MADPRLKGMDVRYGARTFEIKFYVNTDASLKEIERRLLAAQGVIRGERNDMVIAMAGEVSRDQAEMLWAAAVSTAHDVVGEKKS